MAIASFATMGGARKHAWTNNKGAIFFNYHFRYALPRVSSDFYIEVVCINIKVCQKK